MKIGNDSSVALDILTVYCGTWRQLGDSVSWSLPCFEFWFLFPGLEENPPILEVLEGERYHIELSHIVNGDANLFTWLREKEGML